MERYSMLELMVGIDVPSTGSHPLREMCRPHIYTPTFAFLRGGEPMERPVGYCRQLLLVYRWPET